MLKQQRCQSLKRFGLPIPKQAVRLSSRRWNRSCHKIPRWNHDCRSYRSCRMNRESDELEREYDRQKIRLRNHSYPTNRLMIHQTNRSWQCNAPKIHQKTRRKTHSFRLSPDVDDRLPVPELRLEAPATELQQISSDSSFSTLPFLKLSKRTNVLWLRGSRQQRTLSDGVNLIGEGV